MLIFRCTGDSKYLEPIPRALAYLERSVLPGGRLARYYELETNRPLYMQRRGDVYTLTYDDAKLPQHYGWKTEFRLEELQSQYERLRAGDPLNQPTAASPKLTQRVQEIIDGLDESGRWIDTYEGQTLVGQPKFALRFRYISSETFSRHVTTLSAFVLAAASP